MGSVTLENTVLAGKIVSAAINFAVNIAPLVVQLWGSLGH